MRQADEVLEFWFGELEPEQWWQKDLQLDALIGERFADLHRQVAQCELQHWRATPRGRLAEVLVLDQFSRHLLRDRPEAFAYDGQALALAQEAVRADMDRHLKPVERNFIYLPYMHSESLLIHELAVELYRRNGIDENLHFELRHKAIIERFGRYPHRNAILDRDSTAEEIEFLKAPGSGF